MNWIALRMLAGDKSKYLGLVFGVTFAALLMTQQVSIFMHILKRTGTQILEVRDAGVWGMDNRVRYLDEAPGHKHNDLMCVRGVSGVDWAVRTYKGTVRARLEDGNTRNVRLTGLDDETLVGAPQQMLVGRLGGPQPARCSHHRHGRPRIHVGAGADSIGPHVSTERPPRCSRWTVTRTCRRRTSLPP